MLSHSPITKIIFIFGGSRKSARKNLIFTSPSPKIYCKIFTTKSTFKENFESLNRRLPFFSTQTLTSAMIEVALLWAVIAVKGVKAAESGQIVALAVAQMPFSNHVGSIASLSQILREKCEMHRHAGRLGI